MFPQSRKDNILVRNQGRESVIYDLQTGKVHSLNPMAFLVWQLCDGQTSAEAIIHKAQAEFHLADAREGVELALYQLSRRGLLLGSENTPRPTGSPNRREALKKLLVLAALPVVVSLTAPKAMASLSEEAKKASQQKEIDRQACEIQASTSNSLACNNSVSNAPCQKSLCDINGKIYYQPGTCKQGVCT